MTMDANQIAAEHARREGRGRITPPSYDGSSRTTIQMKPRRGTLVAKKGGTVVLKAEDVTVQVNENVLVVTHTYGDVEILPHHAYDSARYTADE